jgi:hypothetical protein
MELPIKEIRELDEVFGYYYPSLDKTTCLQTAK